ncbi:MAG: gliding motility-associated C-terminal domain-containing protein [Saprospiraceae bacterium]|nr:gliding motility-associated C-terminal domain-containing protein [Saprospiraceae bacterium]
MKNLFLTLITLFFYCKIIAQTIFYENFENVNTTFDATPFYKNQAVYCNGHIRNNSNIDCYGTAFVGRLATDMTLRNGVGKFLFHGTYYPAANENTLGEVWGTQIPLTVQPNTQYALSFYIANVFANNAARIQPFINGVSLGTYVSAVGEGNSSWTRFSFCWQSGSATTADLSLRNLMDNAVGNDFALDEIRLEVASINQKETNYTVCFGESIQVGTKTYNTTGVYTDVFKGYNGCDSIIKTNLIVLPQITKSQNFAICRGESIRVGSNTYTQSGTYTDRLRSFQNCDSVVTTILAVNDFKTTTQSPVLCNGGVFRVGTKTYNVSGSYRDTFRSVNACDSIVLTNLTILQPYSMTQNLSICQGSRVIVGTKTYSTEGVYKDTLKSILGGCDSIVTTNLQVKNGSFFNQSATICTGEKWVVGSKSYTITGIYKDTLKNFSGCDSVVTTNLAVIKSKSHVQSIVLSPNQSIVVGTKTYACTGRYIDTLESFQGCDSVITTVLKGDNTNRIFIPNVFSPNDDKNNDLVLIYADEKCVRRTIKWAIYSRWGERVFYKENFQPNDSSFGWDGTFKGKILPPDLYTYFAEIEYADGSSDFIKGDITLIR